MRKIFRVYLTGASYKEVDIESTDIQEAIKNIIKFLIEKGYTTPLIYITKIELISTPITLETKSENKK